MTRMSLTFDDGFWIYFGYGKGWEPNRCDECYELVEKLKTKQVLHKLLETRDFLQQLHQFRQG